MHLYSESSRRSGLIALVMIWVGLALASPSLAQDFIKTGTYTGDGTSGRAITGIGFQPELVIVKAATNKLAIVRTQGMAPGLSKKLADNKALEAGFITSLDADGFTLGNKAEVNGSGVEYHWTALRSEPGKVAIGQYVGTGTANTAIPVPGMLPDAALIIAAERQRPVYRTTDMDFWESYSLDGAGLHSNSIGWFNTDVIYVGTNRTVNQSGRDFFYLALNTTAGEIETGMYWGDNSASRTISGLGMSPEYLLIANDNGSEPVNRPATLTGDASFFYTAVAIQNNLIQSMTDGSFQIGNHGSVNGGSGQRYFWLALANPVSQADISVSVGVDDPTPDEGQTLNLTVDVTNLGFAGATGLQVTDLLPSGLTFVSAIPEQGTYDDLTGIWDIGSLANAQTLNLSLTATVDAGTGGQTLAHSAAVSASDLLDPDSSNNSASQDLTVTAPLGTDIQVALQVDDSAPIEGQVLGYTVIATNNGPDPATGVRILDLLPTGLTFSSSTPGVGTYDDLSGLWTIGNLAVAAVETLTVSATVDNLTGGTTLDNTASVANVDQADPNASNDSATVQVTVKTVDIQISLLVNNNTPQENALVTYTVLATNLGQTDLTSVQVSDLLPAGLTYQSDSPTQGTYNSVSGVWSLGNLATATTEVLGLTALVDAGTVGNTITNTAFFSSADQADGNAANDSSSVAIVVAAPDQVDMQVTLEIDNTSPGVSDPVLYTLTVANAGPGDATGVVLTDILPAEASFVSAMTNKGNYDDVTGLWTVNDLSSGFQAVLNITAQVQPSAIGQTVTNSAAVTGLDQVDSNPGNNNDNVDFTVPTSDLQMSLTLDNPAPSAGDTVTYFVKVANAGPGLATGIAVSDLLPAGLTFVSAAETQGTYDSVTGLWSVGNLNPGLDAQVDLSALVDTAAAGSTVTNTASVSAVDQADPVSGNNTASANIIVPGADLSLVLNPDTPVAQEGTEVSFNLALASNGPDAVTGVQVDFALPAGLTYVTDTPGQGSLDPVAGLWDVGNVASGDTVSLSVTASVDPGTGGSVIGASATISASSLTDPDTANNTATASITVPAIIPDPDNLVWPLVGGGSSVSPGTATPVEVLTFAFVNRGSQVDTLSSLVVTNLTSGSGTNDQMDAEWQTLYATHTLSSLAPDEATVGPAAALFSNGLAGFNNLDWAVPAGDTLTVRISGGASLAARDDAVLRLGVAAPVDLGFTGNFNLVSEWPLVSGQSLTVDGFVAAQAVIIPREAGLLPIGSQRNLALTVDLPGNGYLDDTLYGLALANSGTAQPDQDITQIELWLDQGDQVFDPGTDILLGPAHFSGDRWHLTGINQSIPAGGRRLYATVDISETAQPTRDIRLSLPAGNDLAVEMFSGNDGPTDTALENPSTLGISVTDRIILTGEWFLSGVALPGDNDKTLLQFLVTNTYETAHTLQGLTFTNTSSATGASMAQLDAMCQQLDLRLDLNNNGELDDLATDPSLGSGYFSGGKVTFGGLTLDLPAGAGTRLFVTADLGLMTAADDSRLSGMVESVSDLDIPTATIVSAWPLQSGTEWTVNGMTAEQITSHDISVLTLGPDEGPVLAMDLTVPANGFAADELTGITFSNDGTATSASVAAAEIWEDGGDGTFDAGSGDDVSLGQLIIDGNTWSSTVLSRTIPVDGLRLFAGLTVASTPQDSVTVKLAVPLNGITVSSGNDGPLDNPVSSNGTLVISTSPLRTSVDFATAATDTGQTGTLTMTVRNAGSETVSNIVPDLGFALGAGLLVLGDPTPATVASLDPAQETSISWPFTSQYPGQVALEGNVQGLISGNQVRRSVITPTSAHTIYLPVPRLDIFPTVNLPFSITRGQQGLVPLNLTLVNPGGPSVADGHLTSVRLSFAEGPDGPGVVPADLLDQIVVSEGTNIYLATSSLPASGNQVDLVFEAPVVVTGSEPVTLGIRLDLRLDSTVPSFMVSIADASWLAGQDAVNGASLTMAHGDGSFPISTGQAMLVSPAAGLNVALPVQDPASTVPGQNEVQLLEIDLSQSLTQDSSSTIDVGRLAFKFHGADGLPLADPGQWFSRLSLRSSFQEHFSGPAAVQADSLIVLSLLAPITISGNASVPLRLYADVLETSPLGTVIPLIGSTDLFDARDGNMNNPVPVTLTTGGAGPGLTVLGPANDLTFDGTGMLPAQVSRGTHGLTVFELTLTNPGATGTAAVRCDSLQVEFLDESRIPLALEDYLDRVQLARGEDVLGLSIAPAGNNGVVSLDINGFSLEPGETATVQLFLDLKSDCPSGGIEAVINQGALLAQDGITLDLVDVIAQSPGAFPFSSGLAQVVEPADEITVAAASLMPPLLAPQVAAYPVLSLDLANPASSGSGGIQINSIVLEQESAKATQPDLGALVQAVYLKQDNETVATADALDPAATSVTLVPDSPLIIQAAQAPNFTVEIQVAPGAPAGSLTLVLAETGIDAGPPGGAGLTVRVLPASGLAFPFITAAGNIGSASLAESYANFPNPFAAGREATTFAYSLPTDARVNLKVLTPHGEVVAVLLRDEPRPAGFHQSDLWSGLNGKGVAVHNGVYLAELVAEFADGSRQRVLRKVAVVR